MMSGITPKTLETRVVIQAGLGFLRGTPPELIDSCAYCLETIKDVSARLARNNKTWRIDSDSFQDFFNCFTWVVKGRYVEATTIPDVFLERLTNILRALEVSPLDGTRSYAATSYALETPPRYWDKRVFEAINDGGFSNLTDFKLLWTRWGRGGEYAKAVLRLFPDLFATPITLVRVWSPDLLDLSVRELHPSHIYELLQEVYKYKPEIAPSSVIKAEQYCLAGGINPLVPAELAFLSCSKHDGSVNRFFDHDLFDSCIVGMIFEMVDGCKRE